MIQQIGKFENLGQKHPQLNTASVLFNFIKSAVSVPFRVIHGYFYDL